MRSLLHSLAKPFKIRGAGVGPEGLPLPGQDARSHWVEGNATHGWEGEGKLTNSDAPVSSKQWNRTPNRPWPTSMAQQSPS